MWEDGNYGIDIMAPDSIIMHIDSNNNGTTEKFAVVHSQKVVGTYTNTVFSVDESGDVVIAGTTTMTGDLTVGGTVTAQEFHAEFVSSSIIYESGSTKFGDSMDDVHWRTGSLYVSGSDHHFFGNVGIGTNTPVSQLNLVEIATADAAYTGLKIDYDIQTPAADSHGLRIGSDINMGMSDGRDIHADIIGESIAVNTAGSDTTSHTGAPVGVDITITNNASSDNDAYGLRINAGTESAGDNWGIHATAGQNYFSGNVGIGTTTPGTLLHLESTSNPTLKIQDTGGKYLNIHADSSYGYIDYGTSSDLLFRSATTERMRIEAGGNVGIGTTNPAKKLDVDGGGIVSE